MKLVHFKPFLTSSSYHGPWSVTYAFLYPFSHPLSFFPYLFLEIYFFAFEVEMESEPL